jgi:alanine dehydrogenase
MDQPLPDAPPPRRATRILSAADVRRLLDLPTVVELQRAAFLATCDGRAEMAPNAWLHAARAQRRVKLLAAHEADADALVVKAVARSTAPGAGGSGSVLLLFDGHDGHPRAVIEGGELTLRRTAASAALATGALAGERARRLAVIGAGPLAWTCLEALLLVRPALTEMRVHARRPEARERFAACARTVHGVAASAHATPAAALAGADVVVTATTAAAPALGRADLRPGQHVNAMGSRSEIAPEAVAAAIVIPDLPEAAVVEGAFSLALERGAVRREELGPSLGEVLAGRAPGRRDADDVTLFDSSGVAIQDAKCAVELLRRAEACGAGTLVHLAD